jgi:hypothetical protein
MPHPLVTLTTDFGTRDYYAAAIKGAVLEVQPEAQLVDLSHDVPAHDIWAGAFLLLGSCHLFPAGTIHLVVIDPGVGSSRRALIAVTERHMFVGPDNGVLSLALDRQKVVRVVSIENEHYFRRPVSAVFHGRDIFGPVAGRLALGQDPGEFGPEVDSYHRLPVPPVERWGDRLEGRILYIDRFGNVITNVPVEELRRKEIDPHRLRVTVNGRLVHRWCSSYAEGGSELFLLAGSCDLLEIASYRRSAARRLEARRGMKVLVETG